MILQSTLGKQVGKKQIGYLIQLNIIECHNINSIVKYKPRTRAEKCAPGSYTIAIFVSLLSYIFSVLFSFGIFPLPVSMSESVS